MGVKSGHQLKAAALDRLADAYVLSHNKRYLAALYLGGYALEMTMKWALSDALGEAHEPKNYSGGTWHDLTFLLSKASFRNALLSESEIHQRWSEASVWDSNWRYESVLPVEFRKKPSERVLRWLKGVELLIMWLNVRA